ncbi:putative nucleoredoxin 1 [Apium graveolens]|uniref:putative nucleoredoxin 1 n=1 Tax=Apium graveolens TaxID=4045 RepID=UPI003D7926FD
MDTGKSTVARTFNKHIEKKWKTNEVGEGTLHKHVENEESKSNSSSSYTKRKRRKRKRKNNRNKFDNEEQLNTTTPLVIKIGDTVNLSDLLFTKNRNYLINSNRQRVEAKHLSGKYVVLYFMPLTPYHDSLGTLTTHLLDVYSKLQPRGDFEIVLVATNDHVSHYYQGASTTPRERFRELFSTMPWPAIPFFDLESRKRLETIFGNSSSAIIDPRGVVLQCEADPLFLRYGADAYPFTNERIQSIDFEDNLVLMQQPLSIKKLLATPERDYLINNIGDQVPLDGLDHKVVGLYFCPCLDEQHELHTTKTLKKLYQELSTNRKEFEIVLVYTHGWCDHEDTCSRMVENSFLNEIKTMPWLALPFKDTNCIKKLQRIFQHPQEVGQPIPVKLVIIGPHGKFIEPLGTYILLSYGAPAYPFSLSSAVNLELEMAKKIRLEMFWDLDTVFGKRNGSQIRFSQYIGKRIIVLYQKHPCEFNDFWKELRARYYGMKGTDDEFEVIHICKGIYFNYDKKIEAPMPWFMHPPLDRGSNVKKYIDHVWPGILTNCGLLAFDRDGSVVRMKRDPELGDNMAFPFYQDGDMENEVLLHVREYIKRKLECVNKEPEFS